MFRMITAALAAAILTTGAVAALADTGSADVEKITISKSGDYCVEYRPITGTRLSKQECHSKTEWAKDGVTFNR